MQDTQKKGFSILEIIISLAIGLLVLAALSSTFIAQRKAYNVQEQVAEIVQTERAAMDIMGREIMMAGYDPTEQMQNTNPDDAKFVGIPYNSNSSVIDIYADLNGDEDTGDANEHIAYAFNSSTHQITRNTGGGAQPFADNVESFSVSYLDVNGNATSTVGEIRQIQVSITVRSARSDANFPDHGGYRTRTLTSYFIPRNLNTGSATTTTSGVSTTTVVAPTTTTSTTTTSTTTTSTTTSTTTTSTTTTSTTTTSTTTTTTTPTTTTTTNSPSPTTTTSTTTTTTVVPCRLHLEVRACRETTGAPVGRYIYIKARVTDDAGQVVTDAAVSWNLGPNLTYNAAYGYYGYGGDTLSTCGIGSNCVQSASAYSSPSSVTVTVTAAKSGCTPAVFTGNY